MGNDTRRPAGVIAAGGDFNRTCPAHGITLAERSALLAVLTSGGGGTRLVSLPTEAFPAASLAALTQRRCAFRASRGPIHQRSTPRTAESASCSTTRSSTTEDSLGRHLLSLASDDRPGRAGFTCAPCRETGAARHRIRRCARSGEPPDTDKPPSAGQAPSVLTPPNLSVETLREPRNGHLERYRAD